MFSIELLVTFVVMGIVFIRQITIYKEPFKINYAPLILVIAFIGGVLHIILIADGSDFSISIRESLIAIFMGLLLYLILNILNQTQQHDTSRATNDLLERLIVENEELSRSILHLEDRLHFNEPKNDTLATLEMRKNFKDDLEALKVIQDRQQQTHDILITKFEDVLSNQDRVMKNFDTFAHNEIPSLDSVVHKHLDILRVEEKDHFNKIVTSISKIQKNDNEEMVAKLDLLHRSIDSLSNSFELLSKKMVQSTSSELHKVLDVFEKQLTALRAQSEAVSTSMAENEALLGDIRRESEIVIKQMVLSSNNMKEVLSKSDDIKNIYRPLVEITANVEKIREDYLRSKINLKLLVESLQELEESQFGKMREHIEDLSENISKKIDESLEDLHKHFNITKNEISPTLQKLQLKNPYLGE